MTQRRQTRRPLFSILSRIAVILLLTLALSACQDRNNESSTSAPSTAAPTATPTPTPVPRVPYVFDLKDFDTVVTRAGESYSIEDCSFLEDGKILITTDYENDIGIVAYIDNLELYNTDPDPTVLFFKDEQVGQANYYRYFEYMRVEDNRRLFREEQELLDAFDVNIGNTPCLVLRYEDETGTLIEKLVKKDSIVLKNKTPDASIIETQYKEALSFDLAYDAFAHYFPEDKKLQTYTDVRAFIDQEAERIYLYATDPDGQTVEMNLPISKIAFQTESPVSIPETAVDMGINVEGVFTHIYFQGYGSPTYGKEIASAFIDGDLIYATYRDSDQMTITHTDATQIVDPIENQLRSCFDLVDWYDDGRLMYYNLPFASFVRKGEDNDILIINGRTFYFTDPVEATGWLVSTRQFFFTVYHSHDLDTDDSPAAYIECDKEVEFKRIHFGIELTDPSSAVESKDVTCAHISVDMEVYKYRFFEDINHNPYFESMMLTAPLDTSMATKKYEHLNVFPAEQIYISGVQLTVFKESGVPIFDMRQGIDTVSEAV